MEPELDVWTNPATLLSVPSATETPVADPILGVVSVGLVENTRLVEVVPVVPPAVNPVMLLKQVIEAEVQAVPPCATGMLVVIVVPLILKTFPVP